MKKHSYIRAALSVAIVGVSALAANIALAAAPEPSAYWNGFYSLEGLTIDPSCTVADGVITIGENGGITTTYPTKNPFTVIADVSDCPSSEVTIFSGLFNNPNADADVRLVSNGDVLKHVWTDQPTDYGSINDWDRARHTIGMAYQGGETTYIDGTPKFSGNALSSSYQVTNIYIGMRRKANGTISQVATGMKVYRLAIFEKKLSDAEIAEAVSEYFTFSTVSISISDDNTSISAIEELVGSVDPTTHVEVTLDAGSTLLTLDKTFAYPKLVLISSGDVALKTPDDGEPSDAALAKIDFSRVEGEVTYSWYKEVTVTGSEVKISDIIAKIGTYASTTIVVATLDADATLILDENLPVGEMIILCDGNLTVKTPDDKSPGLAELDKYDFDWVSGAVTYSWATATGARVVAVNFRSDGGRQEAADQWSEALDVRMYGKAWNNTTGASQMTPQNAFVYNLDTQTKSTTESAKITWQSNVVYSWDNGTPFLKGYLDDGQHPYRDSSAMVNGVTIVLTDIPFEAYKLVVYLTTDMGNCAFAPVKIYGDSYTCDSTTGFAVRGDATWGRSQNLTPKYGVNAICFERLMGNSIIIQGGPRNGSVSRGCIAAIMLCEENPAGLKTIECGSEYRISEVNKLSGETIKLVFDDDATLIFDAKPLRNFTVTSKGARLNIDADNYSVESYDIEKIDFAFYGELVWKFRRDELATRVGGQVYTKGRGTEISPIPLALEAPGGEMTLKNAKFYLGSTVSGVGSIVNFEDATVYVEDEGGLGVGMGDFRLLGSTYLEAEKVILSQGAADRTAVLTLSDDSELKVSGSTIVDSNQSSIMFGHWNGPSTFNLRDNAKFTAPNAQVLVGKTGNTQTINIEGGIFDVKGIKLSKDAGATSNTLNISGGELRLGDIGIDTYAANKKMAINVTGNAKITATEAQLPITQNVTVSQDKTLTVNVPKDSTVTFYGEIVGGGNVIKEGEGKLQMVVSPGVTNNFNVAKFTGDVTVMSGGGINITHSTSRQTDGVFTVNGAISFNNRLESENFILDPAGISDVTGDSFTLAILNKGIFKVLPLPGLLDLKNAKEIGIPANSAFDSPVTLCNKTLYAPTGKVKRTIYLGDKAYKTKVLFDTGAKTIKVFKPGLLFFVQ